MHAWPKNCSPGEVKGKVGGAHFSIVCIQSMMILIIIIIIIAWLLSSDHTVQCNPVESACTTTTPPVTSDPYVPHSERLYPSSMHSATWAKTSLSVSSFHSFLVCLFSSKEARPTFLAVYFFSAKDLFLTKEKRAKESTRCHMIAFLFWTDTVQS